MSGSTTARREVSEWLKTQNNEAVDSVGRIEIDHAKVEERRIFLKEAKSGNTFSITYQEAYPNSGDEYLFLETESKVPDFVAVVNDLTDFVYGQPLSLTLTSLLDQLKRYLKKYSAKKKRAALGAPCSSGGTGESVGIDEAGGGIWVDGGGARAGSDDEDMVCRDEEEEQEKDNDAGNESDYVYEDDDEGEAAGGRGGGETAQRGSSWLDEHPKKKSWETKERALREEIAANKEKEAKKDANVKEGAKSEKVENIFMSKASSAVLTQDLLGIQRLEQELGMEVEAVDDNIFHWKVKINRVSSSSPLYVDLEKLRQNYSYGFVEMELTFTMDLYPFYPPLMKLVRPRFQRFMMHGITSLEMLQLSKWSSTRGMKEVLVGIRTALEDWGRLDLKSNLNDAIVHPEGCYTELEHVLMRLELVTEIRPHASMQYGEDALWDNQGPVGGKDDAGENTRRHCALEEQNGEESTVQRKRKRHGVLTSASPTHPETENGEASGGVFRKGTGTDEKAGPYTGTKGEVEGSENDTTHSLSWGADSGPFPGSSSVPIAASLASGRDSGGGGGSGSSISGDNTAVVAGRGIKAGELAGAGARGGGGGGAAARSMHYWAADTRYGQSGAAGEKWDAEAYLAAQREQDRLKEEFLQEITYLMRPDERRTFPEFAALREEAASTPSQASANPQDELEKEEGEDATAGAGGKGKGEAQGKDEARQPVSQEVMSGEGVSTITSWGIAAGVHLDISGKKREKLTYAMEKYRVDSVNSSLGVLEESCLVPFLQQLLENDSLLDIYRHAALYTSVFKLVKCIASWKSLRPLLGPMKEQKPGRSLYRLLSKLGDRAKVYRSTTSKDEQGESGGKAIDEAKLAKDSSAKATSTGFQNLSAQQQPQPQVQPQVQPQPQVHPTVGSTQACNAAEEDIEALMDLLLITPLDILKTSTKLAAARNDGLFDSRAENGDGAGAGERRRLEAFNIALCQAREVGDNYWYSSTLELQVASLDMCGICRAQRALHVNVGIGTPESLWKSTTFEPESGTNISQDSTSSRVPIVRAGSVSWAHPELPRLSTIVKTTGWLKAVEKITFLTPFYMEDFTVEWPISVRQLSFEVYIVGRVSELPWPASLEQLSLGDYFNQPIVDFVWPARLLRLSLGNFFNKPIIDVKWPAFLLQLSFGDDFNQPITGVVWPISLKQLSFGKAFDQPIIDVKWPPWLPELSFGDRFNQPISGVVWPVSLERLSFGDLFNRPIATVAWPISLRVLSFGKFFNQPISPVAWPAFLQELSFGAQFNQPVEGVMWPTSLNQLAFRHQFNQPISAVVWPASLQELSFGASFNQAISGLVWPAVLTKLSFGHRFNQPVGAGEIWPASLKLLQFGCNFNQPIIEVVWPSSMEQISFGRNFNQSIAGVVWPTSLEQLAFGHQFNQPIASVQWPSSLLELSFGDRFNKPITKVVWPPSLLKLSLGRKLYGRSSARRLANINWPASLRILTFGGITLMRSSPGDRFQLVPP